MMIDREVFNRTWNALLARFNREQNGDLGAVYFDYLASMMTNEEFRLAARAVFVTHEFFPRPVDFVLALDTGYWPMVMQASRLWRPQPIFRDAEDGSLEEYYPHLELYDQFPSRVKRAIGTMGGLHEIKSATIGEARLRKRFLEALEAVQQSDAMLHLHLPPEDRYRALGSRPGGDMFRLMSGTNHPVQGVT